MSLADRLMAWLMPRPAKTWPIDNAIQGQTLSGILKEEGIPHRIRRNGEALFGYPEQAQEGWGRLETEEAYYGQVEQLYQDFLNSKPGVPEDDPTE